MFLLSITGEKAQITFAEVLLKLFTMKAAARTCEKPRRETYPGKRDLKGR
jgi:hypothetical protein